MPHSNPLSEAEKKWRRCNNRTKRYGNWRQLYHDALGICQAEGCGSVDNLEIHEETDGISVITWKILCMNCHLKREHGDINTNWIRRKYLSKLSDDINIEITKCRGLEEWKEYYNIKDKK